MTSAAVMSLAVTRIGVTTEASSLNYRCCDVTEFVIVQLVTVKLVTEQLTRA